MIFTMNVELHGYVLMPNHVHLLITPKGCNLSQFLFRLQGTSARYINRVLRWHGQLWDHYCYDRILQTENERAAALHYIHQNPVKGGLVTHAENYPWIGGEELFHGAPEGSPTIPV